MRLQPPHNYQRIGLLGGSFDPPHWGHIRTATGAADELKLDPVAFLPALHPPHKQDRPVSDYALRRAMIELCLPLDPRFRLCVVEEEYSLPGTTVETVQKLRELGFTEERCHLVWLIGSDSLLDLSRWHQSQRLLESIEMAVLPRPGYPAGQALQQYSEKVAILNTPQVAISAQDIRAHRAILEASVPPPVAQFIRQRGLYSYARIKSERHQK